MNYQKAKILLILDVDETLIHATKTKLTIDHDFKSEAYYIYKRPYLEEFLTAMNENFKLAIWSSADEKYIEDIVSLITPSDVSFEFVWSRSRCTTKWNYELDRFVHQKRLKKVKKLGFELKKMLIVDDSPEKTKENFGNAIYIPAYIGDLKDEELKKLAKYLFLIKENENVRQLEKRGWNKEKLL